MSYATDMHRSALFVSGLLLALLMLVLTSLPIRSAHFLHRGH